MFLLEVHKFEFGLFLLVAGIFFWTIKKQIQPIWLKFSQHFNKFKNNLISAKLAPSFMVL
jgi:hypothetical protein